MPIPVDSEDALYDIDEEWDDDMFEEAFAERIPRKKQRGSHPYGPKPTSPLAIELEQADWPPKFRLPASLPEYDGESDPRQFLLRYITTISSGGGTTQRRQKP